MLSVLFKVGGGGGTCSQAQPSPAPQTLHNYLRLPVLCMVESGGGHMLGAHAAQRSPAQPIPPNFDNYLRFPVLFTLGGGGWARDHPSPAHAAAKHRISI